MMPRVTVLMPVHNVEKHVRAAIDSVLGQTYRDFEFLIVDDCSTDSTPAILDSYDDARIVRVRNPQNSGIVVSLNSGLAIARGEFIARMDGDDICLPGRLAAQVAHMETHPDVVLLGTKYVHIDDDGAYVYHGHEMPPPPEPGTPGYMRWSLLWMTSIQHPTAMIRRSVLEEMRYDAEFFTAEDYELWARLGRRGKVERLQQVFLHYRVNPAGISMTKRQRQLETHLRITQRELNLLMGTELPDQPIRLLFQMVVPQPKDAPMKPVSDADPVGTTGLFYAIRRRFFQTYSLNPDERAHIERETERILRRMLAYARAYAPLRSRLLLRLQLAVRSPRLALRLVRESVATKLAASARPARGEITRRPR